MGLEGVTGIDPDADSGDVSEDDRPEGLLTASGLAGVLQDFGTNEQNARYLNFYLDGVSFDGGAPEPLSENLDGGVEVTSSSIVFDSEFTRERYGKAAVSDNISLESDRIDLLLDDNQTESDKALTLISSLEFDNGLSAVQSMTSSDVTDLDQPDLDKYDEYPESMFTNATELNEEKETFVFDAVAESDDSVEALAGYE